jgi:hypothetical protein
VYFTLWTLPLMDSLLPIRDAVPEGDEFANRRFSVRATPIISFSRLLTAEL